MYSLSAPSALAIPQPSSKSCLPIFLPLCASETSNSTSCTYCALLPKRVVPTVMYPTTASPSNAPKPMMLPAASPSAMSPATRLHAYKSHSSVKRMGRRFHSPSIFRQHCVTS